MKTNIEIEFKTPLDEKKYYDLLNEFELENNIFKQTNFYFDSEDLYFRKNKIVLRIRKKGEHFYKITMKSHSEQGAYEQHVLLDEKEAVEMLQNGFNTKEFFEIDQTVTLLGSLDNYRVSTPYKDGELFLDKVEYYGITDYELEYEVDHYETGKKCFEEFLKQYNISLRPSIRKSERVYTTKGIKA
ncbi:MAG: CYTH domain-containing protein [Acholeplasma sp.]|nr:CYTH domain-containing protein [Acholeplasma sp.]